MKINCIIDTCSCVYLSNAEFSQKSLLRHLNDSTHVYYSHEVHRELIDHKSKGPMDFFINKKYALNTQKHSIENYQKRMVNEVLPSRRKGGSRGEIDNFLLAIDLLHHTKKGAMVYITDDKKAINGKIGEWAPSFPGIQLWTSYDVLLFLYAHNVIPTKAIALDLIRDINATVTKNEPRSEELTARLQKLVTEVGNKIEKVSRIFS